MTYKILVSTKDLTEHDWLNYRKHGIGGSDAAIICNLSKWKSKVQLYLEKCNLLNTEATTENESIYWGKTLEDTVAKEFTKRTGIKLKKKNAILQSIEYPFMIANVDRMVVGENSGFEAKTTGIYNLHEWEDGNVPLYYQVQCQHYMAVTGCEKWYIAVLIGGNRFIYNTIERNENIINNLIKLEEEFWSRIEKKIPPEVDGSEGSDRLLNILYPPAKTVVNENLILPEDTVTVIEKLKEVNTQIAKLSEEKSAFENKIKMNLGENEVGKVANYEILWKTIKNQRIDTKKLKVEKPEIYEQYLNLSSYRKFSIKEN